MARVEKMVIQGIRSFGPENGDAQKITFSSPLTLILGQNGCGKTTIIEALKYSITGDLPPGCNHGQSFIHDPKIANQPEVRGKVQLMITDVKSEPLAVSRGFQATRKLNEVRFKTLDSTLTRRGPNGEPVQSSKRCIDVDLEMCTSMGVTKAMINNVILCHQEDSNWPLDENKKLKERFDAIFDTTKLNKCLEYIRKKSLSISDEAKKIKDVELKYLKKNKEMAQQQEEELRETERKINVAQDQVEKIAGLLAPIEQKLQEIYMCESDIVGLMTEKETKAMQIKSLREQQEDLKRNVHSLFKGSVDELKETMKSFQLQLRRKEGEITKMGRDLSNLKDEERHIGEQMNNEQRKIGQLQSEEDQHQKWIHCRDQGLIGLSQDLILPEPSLASPLQVEDTMKLVTQKLQDSTNDLEKLRVDLEEDEQCMQNKVDTLRDTKVKLEQEITMKTSQLKVHRTDMQRIQKDISEVEKSAGRLEEIEKELSYVKLSLERTALQVNTQELQESIKSNQEKQSSLKDQLDVLYKEVQQLQVHSSAQAEINLQREIRTNKEAELRRLKNKNGDTLTHLLGSVPDSGLKERLKQCLDRLAYCILNGNSEIAAFQKEVTKLEMNRRHKKEQLDNCELELKEDLDQIYDQCGHRDLEEVITDLADRIRELQDQKGILSSQEHLFHRYMQKLSEEDPCCPVCHRNFTNVEDAGQLVDELNNEVRSIPSRLRSNNEKLERLMKEYDALLQLRPTSERIANKKENLIPKLKEELNSIEKQLESSKKKAKSLQDELTGPQADEQLAKSVQGDVVLMEQYQTELRRMDRELQRLQSRIPSGVSSRTLEEALQDQDNQRAELSAVESVLNTQKEKLATHSEKLQKIHEHKNKLVEEQLQIQGGAQKLKQFEERLAELQATSVLVDEEIVELKSNLSTVKSSFEEETKNWNSMKKSHRLRLDKERNSITELQKKLDEICKWQEAIEGYERRHITQKLADARDHFSKLSRDRDALQSKQKLQMSEIDMIKVELSQQQVRQRELEDNLKLMEHEAKEKVLKIQLEELLSRIGNLNIESLLSEKKRLQAESENLNIEKSQTVGRMKELQQNVVRIRRQLADEMLLNAAKDYHSKLLEAKVKELAAKDLHLYYKAMDWAMMHFHRKRMKVINNIIRELWCTIYQGNDIDCIQIKTNESETQGASKRISYQYKVVQIKNGVELDMRSRCSAGQKVLASLIIRIALAEALSNHCSILALDEPTTNLDQENIKSLAQALAEIVNTRMVNKGFQLIVITHDEDFLQRLMRVDALQHYYCVRRNGQGKSVIEKRAIKR